MNANASDRDARKQLLLTRIALERAELRGELARVNQAARLPSLLRGAIGGNIGASLFGAPGQAGHGGWVGLALSLLRRYRIAAALLGSAGAIVRGRGLRRGLGRSVRLGAVAAVAWLGWRFMRRPSRGADAPRRSEAATARRSR